MPTLDPIIKSLLPARTHRFATLWKIARTDGVNFFFTDHDAEITFPEGGDTYTPAGGFDASARRKQEGLKTRNLEIFGMLSSAAITHDDLRAGRFRETELTETTVDWRYPWMGSFGVHRYWLAELKFSGEEWQAQVAGITRWLRQEIGRVLNRPCRHTLGDPGCKVDLIPHTITGTVSTVSATQPRNKFFSDSLDTFADGHFDLGLLIWTLGDNDALEHEVKTFLQASGEINLQLNTPFDIQAGDTFTVYPGCEKIVEHCKGTSGTGGRPWPNNIVNFGGFDTMPGTDAMIRTPDARLP